MDEMKKLPQGNGEMGELIRNHDWAAGPLGPRESWPLSLRVHVRTMLGSQFPMLIFWGPELITFYNDAFRQSLGNTASLGQPGDESCAEAWSEIGTIIRDIMAGGTAVGFENKKLPLYRDEHSGHAYRTYSFSPLSTDSDEVGGVLLTCVETTAAAVEGMAMLKAANASLEASLAENVALLHAQRQHHLQIEQSQQRLLALFEQSPVALATIIREDLTFTSANTFYASLVGRTADQIVGKPLLQALPEIAGQGFDQLLREVLDTGVPFLSDEVPVLLERAGRLETVFVNLAYQPMRDERGTVSGILVVATDVTPQVVSRRSVERSEARFQHLVRDAAVGMILLVDDDMKVEMVNDAYCSLIGHPAGALLHRPLFEVIPEAAADFRPIIDQVRRTGEDLRVQQAPYRVRAGNGHTIEGFISAIYQPFADEDGYVSGVMVVVYDVTAQVEAQRKIEASEAFQQLLSDSVPAMIFYLDPEQRYRSYNKATLEWYNARPEDFIGKTTREFIGETAYARIAPHLERALAGERRQFDMPAPARLDPERWLNIVYTPHKAADGRVLGVIVHATDITKLKATEIALRTSEARFRSLIEEAPIATCLFTGREQRIELANEYFLKFIGKDRTVIGKPLRIAMPELEGQPFLQILDNVFMRGETYAANSSPATIEMDGRLETHYFDFTYKPLRDIHGVVYGVLEISARVTEQVLARKALEENEARLAAAVELAELATWRLDLQADRIRYSDRMTQWLGIPADALRGDFWSRIHPDDRARIRQALVAATDAGGTGVFDEIYKVIHAGSGTVRVLHASGKTSFSDGGLPLSISGTARDITLQREQQLALQQEVHLRTEELAALNEELQVTNEELADSNSQLLRSNDELAQYAYVASHDLQEPLRKIQIFSGMLDGETGISETGRSLLGKIIHSARRMSSLIRDLLDFSRLLKPDEQFRQVDLNEIVRSIAADFELIREEKAVLLDIASLPTVEAIPLQMNQLFHNLISNALKFTRPGVRPEIRITASVISGAEAGQQLPGRSLHGKYHRICVADNGIGFEQQYADQIFEIFKRLHGKDEYAGSGIGLALCRRIVDNHDGAFYAESLPGEGATFCVLLPVPE